MANNGTSITVENLSGLPLILGEMELVHGTWLIKPTDVPNLEPPKTFQVHSDIISALGSEGTVHYTINTPVKKTTVTIKFKSNALMTNFVDATVDNSVYKAIVLPTPDMVLAMSPVIAAIAITLNV